MNTLLKDLFDYNHFANECFVNSFYKDGFAVEKGIRLFSHILNAHHIWLARIQGITPEFGVWDIHIVNSFEKVNQINYANTLRLLEESQDLLKMVNYQNSKGEAFQNSIQHILLHIVNHSTYHRGQVASLIRENGLTPPSTDFIYYKRD